MCGGVGVFFHSHVSVLAIGALLLCYVMSLYFLTTDQLCYVMSLSFLTTEQWVPSVMYYGTVRFPRERRFHLIT